MVDAKLAIVRTDRWSKSLAAMKTLRHRGDPKNDGMDKKGFCLCDAAMLCYK